MAYDTYSYRGTQKPLTRKKGKTYIPLWNSVSERNGKLFYSINVEHPFVQDVIGGLDAQNAKKVRQLIKLLAETLPAESIGFEASKSDSKRISAPYETEPEEYNEIKQSLLQSLLNKGMSQDEAEEQIEYILNL